LSGKFDFRTSVSVRGINYSPQIPLQRVASTILRWT
jgi:hypothetical protein